MALFSRLITKKGVKLNKGLREVENMCLAVTVILLATKEALSLIESVLLKLRRCSYAVKPDWEN